MLSKCASVVLLLCLHAALAARTTRRSSKIAAVSDQQKEVDSLKLQLAEREAALASALAAGDTAVEGGAGQGEGGASSADHIAMENATGEQHSFLEMTPQELLKYKHTVCGARWPSACAKLDSASTGATDGWLCSPADGSINGMTIYRNDFQGLDEGPGDARWKLRPRCVAGQCRSTAKDFGAVGIKKISEVGAQICKWALETPTQVTITVQGREEKVDVKVLASTTEHEEDLALQLNVPVSVVEFPANSASFKDEAAATEAIRGALAKLGAVETAVAGKMCGHGFTDGPPNQLVTLRDYFLSLMTSRARRVAEVAAAGAANPKINLFEAVAHLRHVDAPCAGLIIKLNGAVAEACAEGDWEGAPL